jgi:hypothetical protein
MTAIVQDAMSLAAGARRVADGYRATGGVARGADAVEHRLLSIERR